MYEVSHRQNIIKFQPIDLNKPPMIEILPPTCFCSFPLFPNYSRSLPIQEMLYELLRTLMGEDLGSRSPFRAPNSQKTAINYDKLGCHTCGCSWALLGCFWASPGLLWPSEGSQAAPLCLWAAPVASLLEPREIMKTTSLMTNLDPQI